MAANDQLIVLGETGNLTVGSASPKDFTPTSTVQILNGRCWTVPVLANARIYARNALGDLVCVEAKYTKP